MVNVFRIWVSAFLLCQAFTYTRLDTINTLQNCLLNRHSWGKTPKRKWGKIKMNERAAVNTKSQEPKILFLFEKGWDKPTAMDFWFSRHLNCLLWKFKYYSTSPSTLIWPKMPKICTFFSGIFFWQNIDIFAHFQIGITCLCSEINTK